MSFYVIFFQFNFRLKNRWRFKIKGGKLQKKNHPFIRRGFWIENNYLTKTTCSGRVTQIPSLASKANNIED